MEETFWQTITDFGDSAVTLPLIVVVALLLAGKGEGRAAARLLLPAGLCGAATGGLKLLLGSCGGALTGVAQISPSGHVAMSGTVYGTLALLLAAPLSRPERWLSALATLTLVGLIAVSRVLLLAHSVPEVIAGLALACPSVALYAAMIRYTPPPRLDMRWLLAGGIATLLITHGTNWRIETYLRSLAQHLRDTLPGCW